MWADKVCAQFVKGLKRRSVYEIVGHGCCEAWVEEGRALAKLLHAGASARNRRDPLASLGGEDAFK